MKTTIWRVVGVNFKKRKICCCVDQLGRRWEKAKGEAKE
jgi:hypothetical protein